MKTYWPYIVVLLLCVLGVLAYVFTGNKPSASVAPLATEAPWPAGEETLQARLAAAGLPALSQEGNALHIHQHLDILVHGKKIDVPPEIGVHESAPPFIAPIHTHDTTGIIHVESPTVETYTLGQFFEVWGVRLTESCLGGYCADATNTLRVYVNGKPYTGDPAALALDAHQEIVMTYGTSAEEPSPIPSSYSFPEGY
ncbi:MAG: hypothetical protein ACM3TU_02315 [Bacillota bacterium]